MFRMVFLLILLPLKGWGTVLSDERGKIQIDLPSDWKYEKNLMGLPHVFLTNEKPFRSSLSVTLTGLEGVVLPQQDLKKNQGQYQKGRQEWAKSRGMKINQFLPYEVITVSGKKMHSIGFEYQSAKNNYVEKSYYLECPNSLVHFKLLAPIDSLHFKEAQKALKEVTCFN